MSDDENIFLFVPNLIGFGRVVLGVASLFYMESDPLPAMVRSILLLINVLKYYHDNMSEHFVFLINFYVVVAVTSHSCFK